MILFTQIIPRKQTQKIKQALLILQYRTLKSRVAQDGSRLTGPGVSGQARQEAGEEAGDGRAEGISHRGARAVLDVAGMHVRSFESSQVEGLYMEGLQYWLARASKAKPHKLGGLDNRNVLSHSPGDENPNKRDRFSVSALHFRIM